MNLYFSSILRDKCLTNGQSESDSFAIEPFVTIFELPESLEEFALVLFWYSDSIVTDLDMQTSQASIVLSLDLDSTLVGKLERVFYEVDQDLLKSAFVAKKER